MVLPSVGQPISFSQIQAEMGGENPISMSEYFADDISGYCSGVSGVPVKGNPLGMGGFRGTQKLLTLFPFISHTFTNANATGSTGPTLAQIQTAYSETSFASNTSFLNMTTQGIQIWTVPQTRIYSFIVVGGKGGFSSGGNGAKLTGSIELQKTDKLYIIIGQQGLYSGAASKESGGGGGGTFVFQNAIHIQNLLFAAGGGGGGTATATKGIGGNGSATTSGGKGANGSFYGGSGGTAGNGGVGGGGTLSTVGTNGNSTTGAGGNGSTPAGWSGGAGGGTGCNSINSDATFLGGSAYGGFGGGGGKGGDGIGVAGAGGGGGYSGGGGGAAGGNVSGGGGGGGGGSFIATSITSRVFSVSTNSSHGYVTIS